MNHTKVLKRAWEILKQYRVLWIFGLILVLTTGSPGAQSSYQFSQNDMPPEFRYRVPDGSELERAIDALIRRFSGGAGLPNVGLIVTVVIVFVLVILALAVISTIARYVSETSMIKMVDVYEETGEKLRFRQGWKLGWSREAWRLFLINLAVFIPVFVVVIVLLGLSAVPLLMWMGGDTVTGVIGTVASTGLFFLVIFMIVVVATALGLLMRFFRRVCVLEKAPVGDSLRQGFAMVKQNWKDVGLMWLITIGINIGWGIVMIPVVLLLIGAGALLGGGFGLMMRGLTGLVMGNLSAWIVAALVGLPVFILVIAIPSAFLGGLKEVYVSSTWTLTYRELRALEQLEPEPLPELAVVESDAPELA